MKISQDIRYMFVYVCKYVCMYDQTADANDPPGDIRVADDDLHPTYSADSVALVKMCWKCAFHLYMGVFCVCVCVYVCVCVCMRVCIHLFLFGKMCLLYSICMYMYTNTPIYTCIHARET
jgi:hypothetical protein